MGGAYYADGNGDLTVELLDAEGNYLGGVDLTGLDPGQEIYRELLIGRHR